MAQVTIYIPNDLESKVKATAASLGLSVSKFIAAVLAQKVQSEWRQETKELSGAWQDFPSLEEIRAAEGIDASRERF